MSLKEIVVAVESLEESFQKVNVVSLPFSRESEFALQAFEKSSYLTTVATKNMSSLRNAIINIATVGLSLNPVLKLAYLVPRGDEVCLDFSYMGMVKVATDSGSVVAVRAEVVYEMDIFEYQGPFVLPTFKPGGKADDPFLEERGKKKGVWCAAKLASGDYVVGFMSLKDVFAIRNRFSQSYKSWLTDNSKPCPWVSDEDEMIKKTILRREYKLWPKTERLANAIEALNKVEGIDFEKIKDATAPSDEIIKEIKEKLIQAKKSEKALLASLPKHECEKIEELNLEQASHALKLLNQLLSRQQKETA